MYCKMDNPVQGDESKARGLFTSITLTYIQ